MGYETKQSRLVLDFLKENADRHYSAEEVYFALVGCGGHIGRTTVYRQLDKLVDDGRARKFSAGDNNASCYQFCNPDVCHNHYHLKCSGCGKLIHTECDFLDKLSSHILNEHRFIVDSSQTVLYGLCRDCQERTEI
ncbi:MAG: transcriptional repressor [Oscillospiraceae bacterium]|nr:transcriptional repressor [Oscillospiraceae bacterium]